MNFLYDFLFFTNDFIFFIENIMTISLPRSYIIAVFAMAVADAACPFAQLFGNSSSDQVEEKLLPEGHPILRSRLKENASSHEEGETLRHSRKLQTDCDEFIFTQVNFGFNLQMESRHH